MFTKIFGMRADIDDVGHRDRPIPGDPVLDVHRAHRGERKVETGDQLHHHRVGQHERIGQCHSVAVAQSGDGGVGGHVAAIDHDIVGGERLVRKSVSARDQRQRAEGRTHKVVHCDQAPNIP